MVFSNIVGFRLVSFTLMMPSWNNYPIVVKSCVNECYTWGRIVEIDISIWWGRLFGSCGFDLLGHSRIRFVVFQGSFKHVMSDFAVYHASQTVAGRS